MFTPYIRQPMQTTTRALTAAMILLIILAMTVTLVVRPFGMPASPAASRIGMSLAKLPLAFVPNAGQADQSVLFQFHDKGGTVDFKSNEMLLALPGASKSSPATLRLAFEGANPATMVTGSDRLAGVVNYLIGNDPAQWHTRLPTFQSVTYKQLYPGVDLRFDGSTGNLKGTYTVAPGANPSQIRWHHAGATNVNIDQTTGNMVINLSNADQAGSYQVVEQAPVAWQTINGQRLAVSASYALAADGSVDFALGSYQTSLPLVIDPTLVYSTFLGGGDFDSADGIAIDSNGNAYVTGNSMSINFPTKNPLYEFGGGDGDAFVLKVNPAGDTLLYSTFIGGKGDDESEGIAVDKSGNAYITGDTDSTNFPTKNAVQSACMLTYGICLSDAFIVKLNADGSQLLYGSFLGGSNPDDGDGIALGANGAAYVVGSTWSLNFPTKEAFQPSLKGPADAFITKFDTLQSGAASLLSSSYLGGSATDYGAAIQVDEGGIYATGQTLSSDFPIKNALFGATNGAMDIFLAKLDTTGKSLVYSTYLGGSSNDYIYGMSIDSSSNVYLTGDTESTNFPTLSPIQANNAGGKDVFVTKVNASGSGLVYSTYMGGSDADLGYGIAAANDGSAYLTGNTYSGSFPVKDPLQTYNGFGDAFVSKLATDGSVVYSTFLGGTNSDYGAAVATDGSGNAYIAGFTYSSNFPTLDPIQSTLGGGSDVFIAKLNDAPGSSLPPPQPGPDLSGSTKVASKQTLAPGETLFYTIYLQNNGTEDATVNVSDPIPAQLKYVDGSANLGGVFNGTSVTWGSQVVVKNTTVALTFAVQPAITVSSPTPVINKASINYDGKTIERIAGITLLVEPLPGTEIVGGYKMAAIRKLGPGETETYTIRLFNSGTVATTAKVTDPIPDKLSYVDNSVTGGGTYDASTKTITWEAVALPPALSTALTFQVVPAKTVTNPEEVTNTATINVNGQTFDRLAKIVLMPAVNSGDNEPPVVNSVTVDTQDVLSSPNVSLHIDASDNVDVKWMFIREWAYVGSGSPHWQVVQDSGWVNFEANPDWTLTQQNGAHFIGVWVADAALNHSQLNRQALDYASLLLPDATVTGHGMVPYLVHYNSGDAVTISLTPASGDADLYVWFPGNHGLPDLKSDQDGTVTETIAFVAPATGDYLIVARGYPDANFNLTITPGGGLLPWSSPALFKPASVQASNHPVPTTDAILTQAGVDPLGTSLAQAPDGPWGDHPVFLPVIR